MQLCATLGSGLVPTRGGRGRLALSAAILLFSTACVDTDRVTGSADALVNAGAQSSGFYFLPPLADPRPATGELNTSADPVVEVCEWSAGACAGAPVARFTRADGGITVAIEDGRPAFYHANWHTRGSVRVGAVYRIRVLAAGRELGSTDVRVVSGPGGSRGAGGVFALQSGRTLPIKFRVEGAPAALKVVAEAGVAGTPAAGEYSYTQGARVPYSFSALPGYENVLVSLDGRPVPASGEVALDSIHLLFASADRQLSLTADGQALLARARAVLTAGDPAAAMQAYLDAAGELVVRLGYEAAREQIVAVDYLAFAQADTAVIERVSARLSGHAFRVASSGSTQSLGVRASLSAAGEEKTPVTIIHMNGIFTDMGTLGRQAADLRNIAAGATLPSDWRVETVYNHTASRGMEPVHNEQARCLQQVASAGEVEGGNTLVRRYATCRGIGFFFASLDLVEALRQVLERMGAGFSYEIDAARLADRIDGVMQSKRNVILVPHSQGNLMAQQAVSLFKTRREQSGKEPETCLSAVSVAAPVSFNWPLADGTEMHGFIAEHDLLLSLFMNRFPQVSTALGDSLRREASGHTDNAWGNFWLWQYYRFRIHLPFVTYFRVPETTGRIQMHLSNLAARECDTPRVYHGYWTRNDGGSYNAFEATVTMEGGQPKVKWEFLSGDFRTGTARMDGDVVVWDYSVFANPVQHILQVRFDEQGCQGSWHHQYSGNDFWQYTSPATCKRVDGTAAMQSLRIPNASPPPPDSIPSAN